MKLTYFNAAGRAESIRLAFHVGGIQFEDSRLDYEGFRALKPSLPYGQVPTLEVDGKVFSQSMALLRYAGKLSGLYPSDLLDALACDEILDAHADAIGLVSPTFSETDEAKKKEMREALIAGPLLQAFTAIDKRISRFGSPGFSVGSSLTIADMIVYTTIAGFGSGKVDYIPASFMAQFASMHAVYETVAKNEKVAAYLASRSS